VLLPGFPLALYLKTRPSLSNGPVALVEDDTETAPVTDCNDRAAQYDVTVGMTIAQARSICPDLAVGCRDSERERRVLQRIHAALRRVGPHVETDGTVAFIEASGLTRLYSNEDGIARKILTVLAPLGYPVMVGLAANKFVARAAAAGTENYRHVIVPDGAEESWLHGQPVRQLALSDSARETLYDLGIDTVGRMAALPVNEVVQRFGSEGIDVTIRARGGDPDLFVPEKSTDDYRARMIFDYPLRSTAAVVSGIERILTPLLAAMARTGRAGHEIRISLTLDDNTETALTVAVEKATVTPARYLRQVRQQLERQRLSGDVVEIRLRILHTATLLLEQTTLEPDGPAATIAPRMCDTIDRTLGSHKLCTVALSPAHLPERNFRLVPIAPTTSRRQLPPMLPPDRYQPYSLHRVAGLRLIQPPRRTEVASVSRDGSDRRIFKDGATTRTVTRRHGPWKLSGHWWETGFDRLYYELQTDDRRQYLVFFDRACSQWFLQGVYD